MITAYILLVVAVVVWKGYYAFRRGLRAYRRDRHDHQSLYEYLLGNGATQMEALRPFLTHAFIRAVKPLRTQWRLLVILVVLGLLVALLS